MPNDEKKLEVINPATEENLARIMHYGGVPLLQEFNILITASKFVDAMILLQISEVGYYRNLLDKIILQTEPEKMRQIIIQKIGKEDEAEDSLIDTILDESERSLEGILDFNQPGE